MAEKSVSTESFATESKQQYSGPKLRVAIIGCGGISETHIRALQTFPDVELVAGVDLKPDRLKLMEEKYDFKSLYTDWKKMLKEIKPDAVTICTPNGVHSEPAIDAANAGCHVIVEKPMAMNQAECQSMIDAAKKNKKKLAVGFQYRYHPNTDFLVRAKEDGRFGNIMFVKCQALRRRGIPNWGVFGQKDLQGGGPMIDIGVHVIEMAHYVMGSPNPVAAAGNTWTYLGNKKSNVVSQWANWDYKTYTVEDLAIGQIRFDNGAILQIEAMFAGHIEKDVWNFTLMGDKGGCQWDPPMIFTDRSGTMVNESPAFVGSKTDFPYLFGLKLRNFVDGCLQDKPLKAPGEAGLAVQKILDGVYRAAEAGKEVAIK
ncbi:MAG TPA: Gfo/Idh/MocA family oxidoreductase [Tepidisphaeraceae bacterium]|jgi:predicted dehydrogenase|nr:Gfo/Idh/MocA family oxidoreductase [Tepidisphaeraceae bacterium]